MVVQIQVVNLQDPYAARADIMSHKEEILEMANVLHSPHIKATDLNVSIFHQ